MNKNDFSRLCAVTLEQIKEIPQDVADRLIDEYEGQLYTLEGEDFYPRVLQMYRLAMNNAADSAVMGFLFSLNSLQTANRLIYSELVPLAEKQRKKTAFLQLVRAQTLAYQRRLSLLDSSEEQAAPVLSKYTVEDILSELSVTVRLNLVTNKVETQSKSPVLQVYSKENLSAVLPSVILDVCREKGVKGISNGLKLISVYLFNIADENRYNPVLEMLEKYKSPDSAAFNSLCEILGLDREIHKTFLKKWLVQSVALAHNTAESPVGAEGVLVLQGRQAIGKTSFFRKLALNPQWFVEGAAIDIRNKDSLINALSGWICELGELDSTLKKEQSELKAFITQRSDSIRLPYAAAATDAPRRTSFCGTVNEEGFLKDTTGNRRYWVIPVKNIDKKRLNALRDSEIQAVWGYAMHLYEQDKGCFRLSEEELREVNVRNSFFQSELKYEQEVRSLLDWTLPLEKWERFSPAELAEYFNVNNICKPTASQIGRVLTRLDEEEEDVEKVILAGCKEYLLPLTHFILEQKNAKTVH